MATKIGSAASKPGWWSWKEVVKNRRLLGIPHFQRGSVWDHGNRVALLESLYHASPCGSFVLWRPEQGSKDVGGPLLLSEAERGAPWEPSAALWLVDGQQRSRSLLALYKELLRNNDASNRLICRSDLARLEASWPQKTSSVVDEASLSLPDEESAENGKVDSDALASEQKQEGDAGTQELTPDSIWFVSLPAMQLSHRKNGKPLFATWGDKTKTTRGSMFRLMTPAMKRFNERGKDIPNPSAQHGLVPLAALIALVDEDWSERRTRIAKTLNDFAAGAPDIEQLDALVPWGPHFVRSFAGEVRPKSADTYWYTWKDVPCSAPYQSPVQELAALFLAKNSPFESFRRMLEGDRFATGFLPSSSVREAIDAYVRINRAGIRVRTEERALAILTRVNPGVLDGLNAYLKDRHNGHALSDARSALTHDSDKELGFAPWMNTVVRYAALALVGRDAILWLNAEAADQREFLTTLDRIVTQTVTSKDRERMRDPDANAQRLVADAIRRSSAALSLLDHLLCEELSLDHRMARPAIRPLIPLLDLLYYVEPEMLEHWRDNKGASTVERNALAGAVAISLIAPHQDAKEMRGLIDAVHSSMATVDPSKPKRFASSDPEKRLKMGLRAYLAALTGSDNDPSWTAPSAGSITLSDTAQSGKKVLVPLQDRVSNLSKESASMNHSMLGWLYAVERRNGAKEFSWEAQWEGFERDRSAASGGASRLGIPRSDFTSGYREEALSEGRAGTTIGGLSPEKQHIVPFANVRGVLSEVGRGGTSIAHRIGNFTWLSSRQNGLDALSNRWTVIDEAREGSNLAARGFSPEVIDAYHGVRDALLSAPPKERHAEVQSAFEGFAELRREWLVGQLMGWFEEHTVAIRKYLAD
jgi:hypothetical protein